MKKVILSSCILLFQLSALSDIHYKGDPKQWHTWSGIQCLPSHIFYPKTIADVQSIIKTALQSRMQVRCYGSGHSINDLVCTEGYLINTDNFNRILEINTKTNTVRVECGIKLKKLYKELAKCNLALANQGYIKAQTIAGALATGTHGTGKTGTLSDFIISIELVDGTGTYHTITADSSVDWLEAARIHLGALGFVYAVTLQCVPLFVLTHERVMKPWNEVLEHFDAYYNNNDYFMLMAHPISNNTLVYTWNKTTEKPTNNFFIHLTEQLLTNEVTNYLTIKTAHIAPGLTNDFIDHFFASMEQKKHREYSYITLSPIKEPMEVENYIEEEIAIDMKFFKEAIHDIFNLYQKYKKEGFELVGFMTCRFVKGSRKALLSPTYDRDSVYISLITLSSIKGHEQFYQEFEAIMNKYGNARPHWGKYNKLHKDQVVQLYGDNIRKFNEVRSVLDPYKLFTNQYIYERLG